MVFSYPLSLSFILIHQPSSFVLPHLRCPFLSSFLSPYSPPVLSCSVLSCSVPSSSSLLLSSLLSHPSVFETGSHVAQVDLKLTVQLNLVLNSRSLCPYLSSAGITSVCATVPSHPSTARPQTLPYSLYSWFSTRNSPQKIFSLLICLISTFFFLVSRFAPF